MIGLISAILGTLGYFGFQPDTKSNNDKQNTTNIVPTNATSKTTHDTIKTTPKTKLTIKKDDEEKENPIFVKNVTSDVVISQNQSGGITAHTINYKTPPRQISQVAANKLISELKRYPPENFRLYSIMNNSESYETAQMIDQVLKQSGWKAAPDGIISTAFIIPIKNIHVEIDKRRYTTDLLVNCFLAINFKPIGNITTVGDTVEIIVGENL